jgi:hypothetical protein
VYRTSLVAVAARGGCRHSLPCTRWPRAVQALAGADIVMLDNYTPARLAEDACELKREFPRVIVEGSGVRGHCACCCCAPHAALHC